MCACFQGGLNSLLEVHCPMMFELLLDVVDRFLDLRDTNAQFAIALWPAKLRKFGKVDRSKPMILPLSIERTWQRPISSLATPIVESVRTPAPIRPYPTGRLFLGVALPQALRARLRSHRPSGTFRNRLYLLLSSHHSTLGQLSWPFGPARGVALNTYPFLATIVLSLRRKYT